MNDYLKTYEQFKYELLIQEKVTVEGLKKLIKKYGIWWVIIVYMHASNRMTGTNAINQYLINPTIDYAVKQWASKNAPKLLDQEVTEEFEKARTSVINKVTNSSNIKNKDEIIKRLNSLNLKKHDGSYYLGKDNVVMCYFWDEITDSDYIVVTLNSENDYNSYVHELNHLVDRHEKLNTEVSVKGLLKYNVEKLNTKEINYIIKEFYKDYPTFKIVYTDTIPEYGEDGKINFWQKKMVAKKDTSDLLSFSDVILFDGDDNIKKLKEYYLSENEIYARISNMKNVFLNKGYLKDINEKITKEHLEMFRKDMSNLQNVFSNEEIDKIFDEFKKNDYVIKNFDETNLFQSILEYDFLRIIPFIDWDNLDDLNLIAQTKDNTSNNLV